MEKEPRPPLEDDILKLCRLTYMLIEEMASADKKEEYNEVLDRVVEGLNETKHHTGRT